MNNRVLCLYYHRVNDLRNDVNSLCVTPEKFRNQMIYLKNNYNIVEFKADWNRCRGKNICITFDDGYLDNLEIALPILEELKIPATFFISSGFFYQNREFWWDELESILLDGDCSEEEFILSDSRFGCKWDTSTYKKRENCFAALSFLMKNAISEERREDWIKQLWKWKKVERKVRKSHLPMTMEQCIKMNDSQLVSIGAHTSSHVSLGYRSFSEQEFEIKDSIDKISKLLSEKIEIFSFPFGCQDDFNDDSVEICKRNGIKKIATTVPGLWSNNDSILIPRNVVGDVGVLDFAEQIEKKWK